MIEKLAYGFDLLLIIFENGTNRVDNWGIYLTA